MTSNSQVKIKIPILEFDKKDGMYEKSAVVSAWINKLIAYSKIHKIYDVMFDMKELKHQCESDLVFTLFVKVKYAKKSVYKTLFQ